MRSCFVLIFFFSLKSSEHCCNFVRKNKWRWKQAGHAPVLSHRPLHCNRFGCETTKTICRPTEAWAANSCRRQALQISKIKSIDAGTRRDEPRRSDWEKCKNVFWTGRKPKTKWTKADTERRYEPKFSRAEWTASGLGRSSIVDRRRHRSMSKRLLFVSTSNWSWANACVWARARVATQTFAFQFTKFELTWNEMRFACVPFRIFCFVSFMLVCQFSLCFSVYLRATSLSLVQSKWHLMSKRSNSFFDIVPKIHDNGKFVIIKHSRSTNPFSGSFFNVCSLSLCLCTRPNSSFLLVFCRMSFSHFIFSLGADSFGVHNDFFTRGNHIFIESNDFRFAWIK